MTSLWVVLALAGVHAAAGLTSVLQLRWQASALSAAAGVSIAYVFLDLMPELAKAQDLIGSLRNLPGLEINVFALALIGVTVAFWVEIAARKSRRGPGSAGISGETGKGPYRLAIASFVIYNAAIGYTVARPGDEAITSLWLYALAIGLHFIVNDHALAEHHGSRYRTWGRWLLVAALLGGWVVGMVPTLRIPPEMMALVLAYVAGGVILNVFRHELPDTDRTADALAFAASSVAFGSLLLLSSGG
jgi:zinc transporter ZupT